MKKVGSWYLPDSDTHFEPYILKNGGYQEKEREHALSFVKEFDVAIDIGAHVGFWTRELWSKFKEVYAFEPMKDVRDCLIKNVPADNFVLDHRALGSYEGIVTLKRFNENNTGNTAFYRLESASDLVYEVPITTLDRAFPEGLSKVDFIKIDVEQYELGVLIGGANLLKTFKPVLNIEFLEELFISQTDRFLKNLGAVKLSQYKREHVYGWK